MWPIAALMILNDKSSFYFLREGCVVCCIDDAKNKWRWHVIKLSEISIYCERSLQVKVGE